MFPLVIYEMHNGGTRCVPVHMASLDGGPLFNFARYTARRRYLPCVLEWAEGAKDG